MILWLRFYVFICLFICLFLSIDAQLPYYHFQKVYFSSMESLLQLCQKPGGNICVGLFLYFTLLSCIPIPHSLIYYSYIRILKLSTLLLLLLLFWWDWDLSPPSPIFLRIIFNYFNFLVFYVNFTIILPISIKYLPGILIRISLNMHQFGENWHLYYVDSCKVWTQCFIHLHFP
jgi:hypothetical protein